MHVFHYLGKYPNIMALLYLLTQSNFENISFDSSAYLCQDFEYSAYINVTLPTKER